MAQSWNDILSYLKLGLGAPLNLLEFSDDELIQNLKDHVLSYFSHYSPNKKYVFITDANKIKTAGSGQPQFIYKIPREIDEPIIDILDVYFAPYGLLSEEYGMYPLNHQGAIDMVIANSYIDAIRSIGVRQTWEFKSPDLLILDQGLSDYSIISGGSCVVQFATIHKTLDTIEPDFYTLAFKKLCLGQTMLWLAALRNKYESIATPFGQINVNWQMLQETGQRLIEESNQFLTTVPPDKIIEIVI